MKELDGVPSAAGHLGRREIGSLESTGSDAFAETSG